MTKLSTGSLTYEGVSFLFGDGTPYRITRFQRGTAGYRTSDRDRVRRDGRQMGRDYKTGPTHELGLVVLGDGVSLGEREAHVGELLARLEAVWSADSLRSRSGAVAELRIGDRVSRGRPREFTPEDAGRWDGTAEPSLAFDAVDDLWYGPEERTTIRFVPATSGGLRFPARAPFRFRSQRAERNAALTVSGQKAAWPVFEIHGPVTNPEIDVVGVGRLVFSVTLAHDQFLVVNTEQGWVKRGFTQSPSDLVALPGALSASGSRLSDLALLPGSYRVLLRGFDSTGTAELRVSVWPTYTSF